jgi:hypothetical protein
MAIRPGTADETCELLGTVLVTKRGVRTLSWCLSHWPASWSAVPEPAPAEIARHFQPKGINDAVGH